MAFSLFLRRLYKAMLSLSPEHSAIRLALCFSLIADRTLEVIHRVGRLEYLLLTMQ